MGSKQDTEALGRRGSGRESTRNTLMEAAARLFADKGYPSTTVPDIVKEAGVGHGTFYEYFASRRDILVAITEATDVNRRREVDPSAPLADQIRDEIAWYLDHFVEHLTLSRIWHVASSFDPDVADLVQRARRRRTKQVRIAFEMSGVPEGLDPSFAATAVTSMLEEFAHRWFVEGEGPGTSAAHVAAAADGLTRLTIDALGIQR